MFPGEYPIVPGEMLSSVLSRAGGISENGFPQGAILVKVEAKKREQEQLERLIASIQRNVLGQSQTREQDDRIGGSDARSDLEFLEEVLAKEAGGRVVIDLPALLAGDADADIQLEAGDSLLVPEFNNTISVIGEVRQPGNFRYESDRSVADYLDFAAGTTVRRYQRNVCGSSQWQRATSRDEDVIVLVYAGRCERTRAGRYHHRTGKRRIPTYVGAVQRGVDGCVPKYRLSLPFV